MQNGHRVPLPDEMTLLIDISRSLGRVEGKVEGLNTIVWDTAKQVRRLQQPGKEMSPLKQFAGVLRLLWPFLMLIVAVVSRVGSGNIDWLIAFLQHVKIQ